MNYDFYKLKKYFVCFYPAFASTPRDYTLDTMNKFAYFVGLISALIFPGSYMFGR